MSSINVIQTLSTPPTIYYEDQEYPKNPTHKKHEKSKQGSEASVLSNTTSSEQRNDKYNYAEANSWNQKLEEY